MALACKLQVVYASFLFYVCWFIFPLFQWSHLEATVIIPFRVSRIVIFSSLSFVALHSIAKTSRWIGRKVWTIMAFRACWVDTQKLSLHGHRMISKTMDDWTD
jgi:hypothetical protein